MNPKSPRLGRGILAAMGSAMPLMSLLAAAHSEALYPHREVPDPAAWRNRSFNMLYREHCTPFVLYSYNIVHYIYILCIYILFLYICNIIYIYICIINNLFDVCFYVPLPLKASFQRELDAMDPAQRHAGFTALGLAGIRPPPRLLDAATARRLLRRVQVPLKPLQRGTS